MPEINDKNEDETQKDLPEDTGSHFDMYHFFSRKDVIFAAILILALLIYISFLMFGKTSAA